MIMASKRLPCNICNKRVLNHCYHLQCSLCQASVHINCLPLVSKKDALYVNRNNNYWFCTLCIQNALPFNHYDDDDDFVSAILENKMIESSVTVDMLNNQDKIFIPFELNDDDTSPLFDIDPDLQYYNAISNMNMTSCNYHLEESFL